MALNREEIGIDIAQLIPIHRVDNLENCIEKVANNMTTPARVTVSCFDQKIVAGTKIIRTEISTRDGKMKKGKA